MIYTIVYTIFNVTLGKVTKDFFSPPICLSETGGTQKTHHSQIKYPKRKIYYLVLTANSPTAQTCSTKINKFIYWIF